MFLDVCRRIVPPPQVGRVLASLGNFLDLLQIINGYAELLKSREFTVRTVDEIELPHCVFLSSYFYTKVSTQWFKRI